MNSIGLNSYQDIIVPIENEEPIYLETIRIDEELALLFLAKKWKEKLSEVWEYISKDYPEILSPEEYKEINENIKEEVDVF